MSHKKHDETAEGQSAAQTSTAFADAIKEIAAGVKALTEAGLGATSAGALACKVWCLTNGIPCPPESAQ